MRSPGATLLLLGFSQTCVGTQVHLHAAFAWAISTNHVLSWPAMLAVMLLKLKLSIMFDPTNHCGSSEQHDHMLNRYVCNGLTSV